MKRQNKETNKKDASDGLKRTFAPPNKLTEIYDTSFSESSDDEKTEEFLSKKTMRLLGSSVDTIDGDKNSELVPKLESVDLVLLHCNLVNNSYQQASKVLFTFVPNKKYGQLITVSPNSLIMLKTINTEFSFIEIWFTDQDNRPLEIEDSVNISLIIDIGNFM